MVSRVTGAEATRVVPAQAPDGVVTGGDVAGESDDASGDELCATEPPQARLIRPGNSHTLPSRQTIIVGERVPPPPPDATAGDGGFAVEHGDAVVRGHRGRYRRWRGPTAGRVRRTYRRPTSRSRVS